MKYKREDQTEIDGLKEKYCAGQATDAEMRRLFKAWGMSEPEINFRMDIERNRYDPELGPVSS